MERVNMDGKVIHAIFNNESAAQKNSLSLKRRYFGARCGDATRRPSENVSGVCSMLKFGWIPLTACYCETRKNLCEINQYSKIMLSTHGDKLIKRLEVAMNIIKAIFPITLPNSGINI